MMRLHPLRTPAQNSVVNEFLAAKGSKMTLNLHPEAVSDRAKARLGLQSGHVQDGASHLLHVLRGPQAAPSEVDPLERSEEVHERLERPILELPLRPISDHCDNP